MTELMITTVTLHANGHLLAEGKLTNDQLSDLTALFKQMLDDINLVSDCHNAHVERSGNEADWYFICTACGSPCDIQEVNVSM